MRGLTTDVSKIRYIRVVGSLKSQNNFITLRSEWLVSILNMLRISDSICMAVL